ncbi:MAG: hypothetical protein ACRD18_15510 [Terriglobia bacterium]
MSHCLRWTGMLLFLSILVPAIWAQDSSQTGQSAPAGTPSQTVANPASAQSNSGSQIQPDTHPLAGAYLFTLGSLAEGHNYLQPEFSIGEMAATNPGYVPNAKQQLTTATVPEGSLLLVSNSRRNSFSAGYLGGGYIYNNAPGLSAAFQSASVSDGIQFRRMSLGISDSFSYLPESAFGFGSFGGLGGLGSGSFGSFGSFGGGLGQINPSYMPSQSILTGQVGSYTNTALVQAQYALSARTSLTAVGSYGIFQARQHQSGFLSGNMIGGSASIGRALTPRDTIGVSYQYGTFHYSGLAESFNSNSVNFNYGRKITGRLALQLSGGPEFIHTRIGSLNHAETLASAFGDLTYARGRNRFGVSGGRYASTGSGILAGADTEEVTGSWSRQLARKLSSQVSAGLARNSALVGGPSAGSHYEYWYGGASLNWALGRYISLYANYDYQRQVTNAGPCTTAVCAGNIARQLFGIGFIFTPRPIGL